MSMENILGLCLIWNLFSLSLQCSHLEFNTEANGICYWIIQTKQNQTDGAEICKNTGGYLAVIPDDIALDAVVEMTKQDSNRYYTKELFIGYYIDDPTDTLIRISGQTALFSNFYDSGALASSWKCVSLFVGYYYQEKCENIHYALCSNISNSDQKTVASVSSTLQPSSSFYTSDSSQTSTTPLTSHQSAISVSSSCVCDSTCSATPTQTLYANMTDELNSKLEEITNALKVEKSTLTSSINKKISADDPRPSAQGIGYIGALILVFVVGGIIALDAPVLFAEIKTALRRLRTGMKHARNNRLHDQRYCSCLCCRNPD
ncbi:hypothetical protein FSP39_003226 [Pinctada imbricata]|uniref:C-type lectin domain-containing protein n=1 Tax=Pinctada imbricata TaxID=66713 RepID=A0AA88XQ46_PINIB|nr:hypothetical protein FSP39_003226 [Pinctada imbricata]